MQKKSDILGGFRPPTGMIGGIPGMTGGLMPGSSLGGTSGMDAEHFKTPMLGLESSAENLILINVMFILLSY